MQSTTTHYTQIYSKIHLKIRTHEKHRKVTTGRDETKISDLEDQLKVQQNYTENAIYRYTGVGTNTNKTQTNVMQSACTS
jgi:hypothetical protein